jgi:hypothetical protein
MKKNRNRNICKNNDGQVALYDPRRGNFILSLDLYDGYLVFIIPIFNKRQTDNKLCRLAFLNGKINSLKNNIHDSRYNITIT